MKHILRQHFWAKREKWRTVQNHHDSDDASWKLSLKVPHSPALWAGEWKTGPRSLLHPVWPISYSSQSSPVLWVSPWAADCCGSVEKGSERLSFAACLFSGEPLLASTQLECPDLLIPVFTQGLASNNTPCQNKQTNKQKNHTKQGGTGLTLGEHTDLRFLPLPIPSRTLKRTWKLQSACCPFLYFASL